MHISASLLRALVCVCWCAWQKSAISTLIGSYCDLLVCRRESFLEETGANIDFIRLSVAFQFLPLQRFQYRSFLCVLNYLIYLGVFTVENAQNFFGQRLFYDWFSDVEVTAKHFVASSWSCSQFKWFHRDKEKGIVNLAAIAVARPRDGTTIGRLSS